jgi:hypothetical protein
MASIKDKRGPSSVIIMSITQLDIKQHKRAFGSIDMILLIMVILSNFYMYCSILILGSISIIIVKILTSSIFGNSKITLRPIQGWGSKK